MLYFVNNLLNRSVEDGSQQSVQLLDYQMRELEKYRTAVHRMGQDILSLRQQVPSACVLTEFASGVDNIMRLCQVRDLEAQNSSLRRNLSGYSDTSRLLIDSQNLDGLTKSELAAKYGQSVKRAQG